MKSGRPLAVADGQIALYAHSTGKTGTIPPKRTEIPRRAQTVFPRFASPLQLGQAQADCAASLIFVGFLVWIFRMVLSLSIYFKHIWICSVKARAISHHVNSCRSAHCSKNWLSSTSARLTVIVLG